MAVEVSGLSDVSGIVVAGTTVVERGISHAHCCQVSSHSSLSHCLRTVDAAAAGSASIGS